MLGRSSALSALWRNTAITLPAAEILRDSVGSQDATVSDVKDGEEKERQRRGGRRA